MTKSKKTQEQLVREKLARDGFVSNLWAINRGIWRLGAVVHDIRHARPAVRLDLGGGYGTELGLSKRHRKNYFYYVSGLVWEEFDDRVVFTEKTRASMERER